MGIKIADEIQYRQKQKDALGENNTIMASE